ncbi:LAFA_0F00980g1_1 [Lachancea sp. 'fantastica']|nr:LAFA_0F00980g1_1 [Lachancea sp. 'fantastica']
MEGSSQSVSNSLPVIASKADKKTDLNDGLPAQNDEEELVYDFQAFIAQLKDPQADPILRYTRSFLNNFTTKKGLWTCEEQQKLIDDFKVFVYGKLVLYEPFKSLDGGKLLNAKEGIEKLIMGKLHNQCFSPCVENRFHEKMDASHRKDLERDEELRLKRDEYSFIEPEMLEIPKTLSQRLHKFTRLAGRELVRINEYKAPRDKMVCVLNACRVLFGFLKHSGLENGGADAFVPVLVYTLLKSDVHNLFSNLNYTERFRFSEFLRGESAYYLSSVQGAADFVAHLGRDSLHIPDKLVFEEQYTQHQELLEQKQNLMKQPDTSAISEAGASKEMAQPTSHTPAPSEYIRRPLDEATSAIISKVSELFVSSPPAETTGVQREQASAISQLADEADPAVLAQELEKQENQRVLDELHTMFPDMDQDLIHDVCEATKYRIGVCVDVLLTLSS